jgi:hypothetical protein
MPLNSINFKKLASTLVAVGFFGMVQAQISQISDGIQGHWQKNGQLEVEALDWKAQWIWHPSGVNSDILLARRSFDLSEIPGKAIVKITASSKYELYVNGSYVNQGPARSAPHHQSFDILDIRSALRTGKNTIAVKVHHQKGKVSYHLKGRAGLLVQLDLNAQSKNAQIISDSSWKVSDDPSWNNNSPLISRFQMVVNDRIDFRKEIKGWTGIDFEDASWNNALPLNRNSGWPASQKNEKATTYITPWTSLVPRDIPYLKEQNIAATHLIFDKEIRVDSTAKDFKLDLHKKSNNQSVKNNARVLVYDFGEVVNGMPQLKIKGNRGSKVDIYTAPYILDNTFTSNTVDSDFHDRIILSGEVDSWKSMYFKPTRYMAIVMNGSDESTNLLSAGIHQLKYPFKMEGSIETPEAPWIEELWKASIKTIDVCTTDAYTDNYRERRQYAQTNYYAALGNYWTLGDTELQRRYLIQIAQEQEANGLMPAYAPLAKDDFMVILDSNCLWIRSLYNYYLFSGDETTVRQLVPAAKRLLSLLNSFTNDYGMIDSPPYAYWLDHTLNDRRGANFTLNGHYLGALKDFGQLLEWLEDTESETYVSRENQLSLSLQKHVWDSSKELFADTFINGESSKSFSEHANAMALAEGIATEDQARKIMAVIFQNDAHNFIKRANGITMVSPAMSYFLHKGLANYGQEQASLELLYSKFGKMLSENSNGTLWEEWWLDGSGRTGKFIGGRTRSDAQTESAFPPDLIATYVLGLKVSEPGMKTLILSQPKVDLQTIKASIPTLQGSLKLEWQLGNARGLKISIPENMKVQLDLESLNFGKSKKFRLNNKKLDFDNLKSRYINLDSGNHQISF